MTTRVHIGHHFFGAGNFGDDLMLAGFLRAVRSAGASLHLTCATPHDHASQARRFPEIEWIPYDPRRRQAAIAACDAWVGLGGTPFQAEGGPWFLDHLAGDLETCRARHTRVAFLGVGVNDAAAVRHPVTRAACEYADRIWTRDEASADWLAPLAPPGRVEAGGDLGAIELAGLLPGEAPRAGAGPHAAVAVCFDGPVQPAPGWLSELVRHLSSRGTCEWAVQEVRPLPGSELDLLARLGDEVRARVTVHTPDYAHETLDGLLAPIAGADLVVANRYHSALAGAFAGCALLVLPRSAKLDGLAQQLQASRVDRVDGADTIPAAVASARRVDPGRLRACTRAAQGASEAFLAWL